METINVTGGRDTIIAITLGNNGDILAAVRNKGIFSLKNQQWVNTIPLALPKDAQVQVFIVDRNDDGVIYISTGTEIFLVRKNSIKNLKIDLQKNGASLIYCLAQDNSNGLWIGTNRGAYYLNNNNREYFDGTNGFTNYPVNVIFKDIDNNMWFGTNGTGLFRFDGDGRKHLGVG